MTMIHISSYVFFAHINHTEAFFSVRLNLSSVKSKALTMDLQTTECYLSGSQSMDGKLLFFDDVYIIALHAGLDKMDLFSNS